MLIGIGCTVPEIVNLPGQSGGEVEVVLNYSSASACNNNNAFSPSQATPSGGVFSATPSGLNINSSTGEVTPVGSTPQAYVIAYAVGGSTSTFDLTINPSDNATFSYSASSFPQDGSNPSPVFPSGAITGGRFSAGSGLVFVDSGSNTGSSSGQINLSASTIGSYTITYNTALSGSSVCPNTSNVPLAVGVSSLAQVNNVYSMSFDGNDYIDCGDSDDLSFGNSSTDSPFSISAWIKVGDTGINRIVNKVDGSNAEWLFSTGTANRTLVLNLYSSGATTTGPNRGVAGSISFNNYINQWVHVACSYDGRGGNTAYDGMKLYFNGQLETNTNLSAGTTYTAMANTVAPLRIGSDINFTNYYFNGEMDEIGIFNVELTANDVQRIYNATELGKTADLNDLTTPPVKWYRMGD